MHYNKGAFLVYIVETPGKFQRRISTPVSTTTFDYRPVSKVTIKTPKYPTSNYLY